MLLQLQLSLYKCPLILVVSFYFVSNLIDLLGVPLSILCKLINLPLPLLLFNFKQRSFPLKTLPVVLSLFSHYFKLASLLLEPRNLFLQLFYLLLP